MNLQALKRITEPRPGPKLTDSEYQVLTAWEGTCVENNVLSFDTVAEWSRVHRSKVRRIVRSLARKGMVELTTGFDDEGMIRGRGYMPTTSGEVAIRAVVEGRQT